MKNYLLMILLALFSVPVLVSCESEGSEADDLYDAIQNGEVEASLKDTGSKISISFNGGGYVSTIECEMNGSDAGSTCAKTVYKETYPSKEYAKTIYDVAVAAGAKDEYRDFKRDGKTISWTSDDYNGRTRTEILAEFEEIKRYYDGNNDYSDYLN